MSNKIHPSVNIRETRRNAIKIIPIKNNILNSTYCLCGKTETDICKLCSNKICIDCAEQIYYCTFCITNMKQNEIKYDEIKNIKRWYYYFLCNC